VASDKIVITEKEFEAQVKELAVKYFGWRFYHPYLSIRSVRGFPDITLLRPPRLIFAELKTDKGKLSVHQAQWLWELRKVLGIEVYIWRPRQTEHIVEVLR